MPVDLTGKEKCWECDGTGYFAGAYPDDEETPCTDCDDGYIDRVDL